MYVLIIITYVGCAILGVEGYPTKDECEQAKTIMLAAKQSEGVRSDISTAYCIPGPRKTS